VGGCSPSGVLRYASATPLVNLNLNLNLNISYVCLM
jgi:hypothetical protein